MLGDDTELGSTLSLAQDDDEAGGNLLEVKLPETIDADTFIEDIVGLTTCGASAAQRHSSIKPPRLSEMP